MNEPDGSPRGRAGGFQDWVGDAAACRRAVTEAFLTTFELWGYRHVATPLVEPVETVAAGVTGAQQSQLFRFTDSDGSLLALVGERTVSVARVVATQLSRGPFPLRLCYAGPVLRNQPLLGGRRREAMQAGGELVGHSGLEADSECVAVAANALQRCGIGDAQIDVGHARFIPSLLEAANLSAAARAQVAAALRRRDLVAVEAALAGTDIADAERALLLAFPTLRGGREILNSAGERLRAGPAHDVLAELDRLWSLLESQGIVDRVQLDLGATRDWDYYTGVTFELFSSDLGFPLGSGGRYDRLLAAFGLETPATGFVLHVDRCVDTLMRRAAAGEKTGMRLTWSAGHDAQARTLARHLRDTGIPVTCDLESRTSPLDGGDSIHIDGEGSVIWRLLGRTGSGDVEAAIRAAHGDHDG